MIVMEKAKVVLNDIEVTRFDSYNEIVTEVFSTQKVFVAINPEKIVRPSEWLVELVNSNVGYVDGVGVLIGLWKKGVYQRRRLPGFKLWLEVIRTNAKAGYYLIGGTQDVLDRTITKLIKDFPGIDIKGSMNGYSYDNRMGELLRDLNSSKPRVIFVALGSPRQEQLMLNLSKVYSASYIGLGGSFDYFIGEVVRTPMWIQRIGFQWLHRAIMEPKRFKRQRVFFKYLYDLVIKY